MPLCPFSHRFSRPVIKLLRKIKDSSLVTTRGRSSSQKTAFGEKNETFAFKTNRNVCKTFIVPFTKADDSMPFWRGNWYYCDTRTQKFKRHWWQVISGVSLVWVRAHTYKPGVFLRNSCRGTSIAFLYSTAYGKGGSLLSAEKSFIRGRSLLQVSDFFFFQRSQQTRFWTVKYDDASGVSLVKSREVYTVYCLKPATQ